MRINYERGIIISLVLTFTLFFITYFTGSNFQESLIIAILFIVATQDGDR
jgi:hypothetical protein